MTIKELIPKLIEHYEKCINEMPEEGWEAYLIENNIDEGVCKCADECFKKDIYSSLFSIKFTKGDYYLCDIPRHSNYYSEAKELLQIRLNRLKEFL